MEEGMFGLLPSEVDSPAFRRQELLPVSQPRTGCRATINYALIPTRTAHFGLVPLKACRDTTGRNSNPLRRRTDCLRILSGIPAARATEFAGWRDSVLDWQRLWAADLNLTSTRTFRGRRPLQHFIVPETALFG